MKTKLKTYILPLLFEMIFVDDLVIYLYAVYLTTLSVYTSEYIHFE
jgi:hypothetical protein